MKTMLLRKLKGASPLFVLCLLLPTSGQSQVSYTQTEAEIKALHKLKHWSAQTEGPIVDWIVQGLTDNADSSDGLKKELDAIYSAKIYAYDQLYSAPEANLLACLYYTRVAVHAFITDDNLNSAVGGHGPSGHGKKIVRAFDARWSTRAVTNTLDFLAAYPPAQAAALVEVVCRPYYVGGSGAYQNYDLSWASESLWSIYHDANLAEFARHSVVARLLGNMGLITIPASTTADFVWSGMPSITIPLPQAAWSTNDIPALQRLVGNAYYGAAAQAQLNLLQP